MKKTLLAPTLLAGFTAAGAAQAEPSVTLYGVLDTGYGYQRYTYDSPSIKLRNNQWMNLFGDSRETSSGLRDGTGSNGSRWGLVGSEDLGDGLRAIFQMEANVNLGTQSGDGDLGFMRQSFVGLSSDSWGTFTMGRQYSAGVDTFLVDNGINMGDADKIFGAVGMTEGNRVENSFKYTTPSLSGFQAIAMYGTGDSGRPTAGGHAASTTVGRFNGVSFDDRGSRVSVGVRYANGPFSAGASYDRQSRYGNDLLDGGDARAAQDWQINAAYDFQVVKLSLAYGRDYGKIGWGGSAGDFVGFLDENSLLNSDFRSNNYHVGLSAPLAGGTLYAGWGYSTTDVNDEVPSTLTSRLDKDVFGNISTYHVNYQYPLSKRTSVYAYGTYGKNLGYIKDLKGTEAGLGISHKF